MEEGDVFMLTVPLTVSAENCSKDFFDDLVVKESNSAIDGSKPTIGKAKSTIASDPRLFDLINFAIEKK